MPQMYTLIAEEAIGFTLFRIDCSYLCLDIEFRGIDEAGTEGIFGGFVSGVDTQLAEDVLAVGGNRVDAGESFGGYFLSGLSLRDGFHDLGLRLCQKGRFLLFLLLRKQHFERSLADKTIVAAGRLQSFAYLAQRAVLEDYAELV